MRKKPFKLGDQTVFPGEKKTINLELPKLYNTPTSIPVTVINGRRDGPVVFISAAIHGDELNGIEIIRRLKKVKILNKIKGTLLLVPIVNVYGTMTLSRYLPDRRDLNRSFPGSLKGSLGSRIAKIFFDTIVSQCDLGIDLHTGAIHRTNLPQIRTNIQNAQTLKLAKIFEAPVVLHSNLRDGSLRACSDEQGIPILLYEAGEALRFDERSIKIGVRGIINVLREKGMLLANKKKRFKTPVIFSESGWIRSPQSGILRSKKRLGESVQKGDIIAYIDDPLGESSQEVHATFSGIIIGKIQIPLVQEGDAVFHVAKYEDAEVAEDKIEFISQDALLQNEFLEIGDD
jgi:hypothetical protein